MTKRIKFEFSGPSWVKEIVEPIVKQIYESEQDGNSITVSNLGFDVDTSDLLSAKGDIDDLLESVMSLEVTLDRLKRKHGISIATEADNDY